MDLKGAEIRNIYELCSEMGAKCETDLKVTIPYYQRPYRWKEKQINNLILDFCKNSEETLQKDGGISGEENKLEGYFVGSVVLVKNAGGTERHDIIDGQQRITTVFLLNYLRFITLRAYIEELISIKRTRIEELLKQLERSYVSLIGTKNCTELANMTQGILNELDTINDVDDDQKDKIYSRVLEEYQKAVGLPKRDMTDMEKYREDYQKKLADFLEKDQLSLLYRRDSYNGKLKKALSQICLIVSKDSKPQLLFNEKDSDEIVLQYMNAIRYEYESLEKLNHDEGKNSLEYTKGLIDQIELMVKKIKFCVIVTGDTNDAYTLFEVLNDRALVIDDLELIKNLFFKEYCTKAKDIDDREIDKNIEKLDTIWGDEIFTQDMCDTRRKLISLLATIYFTADERLIRNETGSYREKIEKDYLVREFDLKGRQYGYVNVVNDIKVYQMLKAILEDYSIQTKNSISASLNAECDVRKSITYKTIHLLYALGYKSVLPALTNMIIKKYIDTYAEKGKKEICIDSFRKYISRIANDWEHKEDEFKDIHNIAFQLWRISLLSKDYNVPREVAKNILSNVYCMKYDMTNIMFISLFEKKLASEFNEWMTEWRFGKKEAKFRAKVLFINLFATDNDEDNLKLNSSVRTFVTDKLHLDHMEAQNPNAISKEKYFEPENPEEKRENYVNSIGNTMILDSEDNNDKSNKPLWDALGYYDNMSQGHWLVDEVRILLRDDRYSKAVDIANVKYRVPKEAFFLERRNRLQKYFGALLNRELGEKIIPL